jgi:hypothetical protein
MVKKDQEVRNRLRIKLEEELHSGKEIGMIAGIRSLTVLGHIYDCIVELS